MKVAIIGAGALGSTFGVLLQEAGCEVYLIELNEKKVEDINNHGITLFMPDGSYKHQWVKAASDPKTIGKFDIVQISVKGFSTTSAAKSAKYLIDDKTPVFSVQNGLGNLEQIAKIVGKERVVGGVTAHSAMPLDNCHIRYTGGMGGVWLGRFDGKKPGDAMTKMIDFLNIAGFKVNLIKGNIEVPIWRKLIANVACNAVAALTGFTGVQLTKCDATKKLIYKLAEETAAVAKKKGLYFDEMKNPGAFSIEAVAGVQDNRVSMLQDIDADRRTEIDSLNGEISRLGRELNVPTPFNDAVTLMVKALEQKIVWKKQAMSGINR